MTDPVRVLIAGGGSGGHVLPGLAVAESLRHLAPQAEMHWLGARGSIEERLVPATGIALHTVRAGKLNRFLGKETIPHLLAVPVGMIAALAVVRQVRPDVVLTCGGFVAAPAGVAAWLTRRPLLALQQDVEPNLANRLIVPFAQLVVVAFAASLPRFPPGKALALGNPLRAAIRHGDAREGRRRFGLPDDLPLVLVTGGSQGALRLNRLVLARLPAWLGQATVVHVCGERSAALAAAAAAALPADVRRRYVWRAFVTDDWSHLLAAADLIVARSGAATLADIAALGKAAILVPLPPTMGRSPQEINADMFAQAGAAVTLVEATTTPDLLLREVAALLADPVRRAALGRAAMTLGRADAAEAVATLVLEACRQGAPPGGARRANAVGDRPHACR